MSRMIADEDAPFAQPGLGHGQIQREGRAVLPQADDLAADADDLLLAGWQIAGEVTVVFVAVRRRHQH